MTVNEIIKISGGTMFRLVDASKVGYMTYPEVIIEGDRNVVGIRYGKFSVVHMEAHKKNGLTLYIK